MKIIFKPDKIGMGFKLTSVFPSNLIDVNTRTQSINPVIVKFYFLLKIMIEFTLPMPIAHVP